MMMIMIVLAILGFFAVCFLLAYLKAGLHLGTLILLLYLTAVTSYFNFGVIVLSFDALFVFIGIVLNIDPLRRLLFSNLIFRVAGKTIPQLSPTEEQALKAGTVGFEKDLFSGNPSLKKLLEFKPPELTKEEQDFMDGPVEDLCLMLNDWQISQDGDLSPEIWQFIKDHGFLSMNIPKRYGGKEFSAWAHASVILKVSSRNGPAAISVGVPNSLGPAELLLRYGTKEQQDHYLPRLARGEEIPCFALTGPRAGSDAASIPDFGVVCYGEWEGKNVLGIRLNWIKRYITLAPIATLIGLAFKLRDPDRLLSSEEELGITCALIPRHLKGISIGKRHNPLDIVFQNGPITGKDVFIPLDYVIGGQKMVGQGWRMLMESLGIGRAVTLPSAGTSGAMISALTSGCYARVRHQFGLPIGRFEGIEQALARIGANAYLNMAALRFVTARIDAGEQPSVASAILKYHTTERCRRAVNDAMDIHGGKGICIGPSNYLISLYRSVPINITVEGANILTRNVIIFPQASVRCHPYLSLEMKALQQKDKIKFDHLLFAHLGFLLHNCAKALIKGIGPSHHSRSRLIKRRFQDLSRYSAAFAFVADVISITLGANLKRKENISARLGDILSYLYLASALLKRFRDDGQPKEDAPVINFVCDELFHKIECRFSEITQNLPNRFVAFLLYPVIFPWGKRRKEPTDASSHEIAQLMQTPNPTFSRLTDGLFKSKAKDNALALLLDAQEQAVMAEELEKRVYKAQKVQHIHGLTEEDLIQNGKEQGIINQQEADQLLKLAKIRAEVIAVDAF